MHDTKRHKDNQLQSLEHSWKYLSLEYEFDIKKPDGTMFNPIL